MDNIRYVDVAWRRPLASDHSLLSEILLQEYERLKEEQSHRIGTRDNLVYANLLSLAGVVAATIQVSSPALLLLLPPLCVVLGWTYLVNDEKISAIGRYVREELSVRLTEIVGEEVLSWELYHRADRRRLTRKIGQLGVDLMTFGGPSVVALLGYWTGGSTNAPLVAASTGEAIVVGWLMYQIVRYADLQRAHFIGRADGTRADGTRLEADSSGATDKRPET
jgi:hypothetical protein